MEYICANLDDYCIDDYIVKVYNLKNLAKKKKKIESVR